MNVTDQVEVRRGLPERHRRRAAEVYYDAFRQKFEPIMGSQEHGVAVLEKAFDPCYALVALHQDQLAGVAGVQYGGHHLLIFGCLTCEEFGWLRGLFKLVLFIPFSHRQRKGELWIDSIVVCPSMRGKGVGTRLLQAVFELARAEGFGLVGLEVVDTNPGAHRLYERMGFVSTETHKLPYLRRVMGFSASTTMVKEIAGNVGKK